MAVKKVMEYTGVIDGYSYKLNHTKTVAIRREEELKPIDDEIVKFKKVLNILDKRSPKYLGDIKVSKKYFKFLKDLKNISHIIFTPTLVDTVLDYSSQSQIIYTNTKDVIRKVTYTCKNPTVSPYMVSQEFTLQGKDVIAELLTQLTGEYEFVIIKFYELSPKIILLDVIKTNLESKIQILDKFKIYNTVKDFTDIDESTIIIDSEEFVTEENLNA